MSKEAAPGYNFIEMEKKWLKHWNDTGVLQKYLHKNDTSSKTFSFMDGPMTANNPMGVHHAWGRTYKDLWQKYHNLKGHRQRFQNGFDCQGLWVEVEVEKELKIQTKKDIENLVPGDKKASIAKFVQMCKDRVYKYSDIITNQSQRLAYFMDWEHSYFTMSDENNYMIWHFLRKCYENGWIYKGHESVPWCPRCETAISQHEMLTEDYKDVSHEAIYFSLPIKSRKNEYLLVWTTTPWTLPANIAVAVDIDIDYSLVQARGKQYWIANALVEKVFKKEEKKIVKTVKGSKLVGLSYQAPFDHLDAVKKVAADNPKTLHIVIATDTTILPISKEEGTGMVHTAVSAGVEDFKLGKKIGLPMIPVIADNADYLPGLGEFTGHNAKKKPRIILNYLLEEDKKGSSWVFEIHNYQHRYPACWRCKTELVWKVADEWYISMDKKAKVRNAKSKVDSRTLRERMIDVAKKISWKPEFGLDRELDWLNNMHDWLISKKNRYWGLSLPIYECKECGTFEVLGSKEELKKRAVSGWEQFEGKSPHKPYIDEVIIKCSKCAKEVERIDDVGNPWLDAGIVPYSTITENNQGEPLYLKNKKEWNTWSPVDFITESFPGQFKNWFYALIAESTALENMPPYKHVLGFGTLLDEQGRPMHKSWGNSIEFNEGADKIGVDVMRWMYSRQNPADNMLFGYKKADEVRRQFYLILWNTYLYYQEYSRLDTFTFNKKITETLGELSSTNVLDQWIYHRFIWLVQYIETTLNTYNAKDAALETEKFVTDLSTWYIRRSRNRVWSHSDNKKDKTSFYETLHIVLTQLSIILSPFLPFISEEIYTTLTSNESVHLAHWVDISAVKPNENLFFDMQLVREVVEVGHKIRKELKLKVRQPLAKATIKLPKNRSFLTTEYSDQYLTLIAGELNVKNVDLSKAEELTVMYDTNLTPELILEGEVRDLVRSIQAERKNRGIDQLQKIELTIPEKFKPLENTLKKTISASKISYGAELKIDIV